MTSEEKILKKEILKNKKRYNDGRDKVIGKPATYRFQKQEISEIIHEYTELGLSCREIARKHSRCHIDISRLLKRNNIKILSSLERSKKYTIQENYFEVIDSHKKAYWLGWLMSDGTVLQNGKEIRIKLQARDKSILEEFNKDLNNSKPLKKIILHREDSNLREILKKEKYIHYESRICCSKMVLDLAKYGIVWNKGKLNSGIKNIPEEFISSFILGEFEGDGSLSRITNKNSCTFCIWDNFNTLNYIKEYFEKKLNKTVGYLFKRKSANIFEYSISTSSDIIKIFNLIYINRDFKFCLFRKYKKFLQFLKRMKIAKKRKTSQFIGVYKPFGSKSFNCRIKKKHLGCFVDESEAARKYDIECKKIYGKRAVLNFPNE